MADQQFCLRWNNHQSTLISVFDTLLENGTLVDCTLAAEGQYLKAHKVVLCACSPYLETLLSQHYEKHPIVILKDVKFSELKSMMDYMYRGEVNISQDQLGTFLKAAESLQIKGLSDNGADGDARDVGSTSKVPQRKPSQSVTTTRSSDAAPESPAHRSRDGSISPTSRKRRRIRRNSQGDDSNVGDSHLDTSNSCDLPSQAQSIPIVPNIPATVTSSITTTPIIKTPIIKPEQTEIVNRIDPSNMNSLPPESGLLKEKIEPSEPLLEPKTEYLEDVNTEDSVEDLTLDDDDEMDGMDISNMSNMSNMSRPGPSHGNDLSSISNQGFAPWQLGGNQSGTDEVFMAAQEAVSAHRDSQAWQKEVTSSLYYLREKIDRIEKMLISMPINGNKVPVDLTETETVDLEHFPLDKEEDLHALEQQLKADVKTLPCLVSKLAKLGGRTPKEAVRRILRQLFTDELASKFSYYGMKGKRIFGSRLCEVIHAAVGSNTDYGTVTNSQIEEFIKDWLRHAKSRSEWVVDMILLQFSLGSQES